MKFSSLFAFVGLVATAFTSPAPVQQRQYADELSILTGLLSDIKGQTGLISESHSSSSNSQTQKSNRGPTRFNPRRSSRRR